MGSAQRLPHIVIIGGGLAGTAVLLRLLKDVRQPVHVTVVESRKTLGLGLAYSTANPQHLLNGLARAFSLYEDEPLHFVEWLRRHAPGHGWEPEAGTLLEDSIAPRKLYGTYIQDTLQQALRQADSRIVVQHRRNRAVAVLPVAGSSHAYRVELNDGVVLDADHLVLATGVFARQAAALPFAVDAQVHESARYVGNLWAEAAWDGIERDERVALLGTGLSSLDALINAEQGGFQGQFVAFSRRGQKLHARLEVEPWPDFLQYPEQGVTLLPLLHQVNIQRRKLRQSGEHWQRIVPSIRAHVPTLWARASDAERRRFVHRLRSQWEASLHRCAGAALAWQERAIAQGRYQARRGTVTALRLDSSGRIVVEYRPTQGTAVQTEVFDRVINCLGFEFDWRKTAEPLLHQLLHSGLVQADALGFGIRIRAQDCAVLDAQSQAQGGLYAIGHPVRGTIWESNAIPEQVPQAGLIARAIRGQLPEALPSQAVEQTVAA